MTRLTNLLNFETTIFTNVALTQDKDVWWEGIGYDAPGKLIDWTGNEWEQGKSDKPAAHPNSRFTAPAAQCPCIAPEWEDPNGVPVSAILFGGRRPSTIPLVHMARNWNHGVFLGSIVGSEVTAATLDVKAGTIRRDPFAMLPFCGYNMGDYFKHWIEVGAAGDADKLPKIFYVNWFRKTADGKWLWPGYGDNSRVLKWIFECCEGTAKTVDTPIGIMPTVDAIDRPEGVSEAMAARAAPAKRRAKADTALALHARPYPDNSRTDFGLAFRAQAHDTPRPVPDVR